ncbi:MAG TPA: glycosyltransferase family 25 protein [Chitinophagaceae bacterium]|nr:glycosyltransferase family 25 protein [Chitinophagaceae bacterium]
MIPAPVSSFLQSYFEKIFVITIKRANDRQADVTKQLEGLPFDFFYGVDKQTLHWDRIIEEKVYDDVKARQLNRYGKGMIVGHIACALSHRKLYEHILERGYKRVLIFEDDVVPIFETLSQLPAVVSELPPDWEMVYFGYHKYEEPTPTLKRKQLFYKILSRLGLLKWSPLMVSNLLPKPYSKHLLKAGFHDLLHGYAVSYNACKKLVDAQTPVVFNSDPLVTYLIMNGRLNAFITRPQFFTQSMFIDPAQRSFIHHL